MNKNIINEGLHALAEKTFDYWLKCERRNDEKSKKFHEEKMKEILQQYVELNGKGTVAYVFGCCTQKNDIFSWCELMGVSVDE